MAKELFVVGNKVDIPDSSRISKHDFADNIVFVGKMDYEPNIVAVTFFVTEVFCKLKEKWNALNFIIVGVNPTKEIYNLTRIDGVQVTGFLKDVEPYYQKATIVVAPMLTGAGIQNKIIQAMAYSCCVVTTPIGADGLVINNDEIAIYEDAEEMIIGIDGLLNNRCRRVRMGKLARDYIFDYLSENKIESDFWAFIGK